MRGVEKWRIKLTSAKVEVEVDVEAELGITTTPYLLYKQPNLKSSNSYLVYKK